MKLVKEPNVKKLWDDTVFPENTVPIKIIDNFFRFYKLEFYMSITPNSFTLNVNGGVNLSLVCGYLINGEVYYHDNLKPHRLKTHLIKFTFNTIELPTPRVIRTLYDNDRIEIINDNGKLYLNINLPEQPDDYEDALWYNSIEILDVNVGCDLMLDDYNVWRHLIEYDVISIKDLT